MKNLFGPATSHTPGAFRHDSPSGTMEILAPTLTGVLDRLPMGIVMVDQSGRIVFVNRAAEEIIMPADGLVVSAGILRASRPAESIALTQLIKAAALAAAEGGANSVGAMKLSRPSMQRALSVVVTPLHRDPLHVGERWPAAAVFVSDPELVDETPQQVMALIYGLTPAEARFAAALMRGHGLEWAADELKVSINTARTHIKNLFEKTGVRRQGEFIRLVLRGPAGLRDLGDPEKSD